MTPKNPVVKEVEGAIKIAKDAIKGSVDRNLKVIENTVHTYAAPVTKNPGLALGLLLMASPILFVLLKNRAYSAPLLGGVQQRTKQGQPKAKLPSPFSIQKCPAGCSSYDGKCMKTCDAQGNNPPKIVDCGQNC